MSDSAFNVFLKPDWGNQFFFLVPIAVASLLPQVLVTRRAVARAATVAAIFTFVLLAGAPVYSWVRFKIEPDDGLYRPFGEAAAEITRLWRERFHSPLPIVVSGFDVAAHIVFYSPDHPKMYADFDPAYSPWIDYPAELKRKGYVGVCFADDAACRANLKALESERRATRYFGAAPHVRHRDAANDVPSRIYRPQPLIRAKGSRPSPAN